MSDREPPMEKREVLLPDGRRLVFYRFPDPAPAAAPPPPPGGAAPARRPEER